MNRPCRTDGRCQYAIDHGAEGLGHCPAGKCVMRHPDPAVQGMDEMCLHGPKLLTDGEKIALLSQGFDELAVVFSNLGTKLQELRRAANQFKGAV